MTPTDPDADHETPTPSPSMSHRVATLLELVGRRASGIGSREAARESGIDRSAVSRIFRQLETLGWVEQPDERGNYTTGPRLFALAAAVRQRDSLLCAASPLIEALAAAFGETAYLAVRRDDLVVYQEMVESTHRIRYVVDLHTPFPLSTGAAGRAVLSTLDDDVVDRILSSGLPAYTPRSITDPGAFRDQLQVGPCTRVRVFTERLGGRGGGSCLAVPRGRRGLPRRPHGERAHRPARTRAVA